MGTSCGAPQSSGQATETPEFYADTLRSEPKLETMVSLRVNLTSKPLNWVKKFLELQGLDVLFSVMAEAIFKSGWVPSALLSVDAVERPTHRTHVPWSALDAE